MWNAHGPELVKLNNEAMDLLARSFTQLLMVDVFNWSKSFLILKGDTC
jgi:hypothetical protein